MRYLFPTLGSYGDVYPLLTLGRSLQLRGHEVNIVANPLFRKIVSQSGLGFVPLGQERDYLDEIEDPDIWHPTRGFQLVVKHGILRMLKPLYETILQFDPQDTVVVSSALLFGAHIAHETHGYKFCTLHLQPSMIRSRFAPPVLSNPSLPDWTPAWIVNGYYQSMDKFFIDPLLKPVNEFRKELGLPAINRFFEKWIHSPQLNIGLFPDWFAPPQKDWSENTHLTGFIPHLVGQQSLSIETLNFIGNGDPPLVFTAGTAMLHTESFFDTAVKVTEALKCRAIFLTKLNEQIPTQLPETIHHAEFEPLYDLLKRSAAFIYHGGIGSMAQGLAAGVPHLVMPMSLDQPDNAARVRRLRVGDYVLPGNFKPGIVSAKLSGLFNNPSVRVNCQKYAQKIDFNKAILDTCDLLENFSQSF